MLFSHETELSTWGGGGNSYSCSPREKGPDEPASASACVVLAQRHPLLPVKGGTVGFFRTNRGRFQPTVSGFSFFCFLFVPSACSLCIVMSLTYQHEGPGKPLLMRDSQVAYYFKNNTASCFSLVPSLRPDAFNKFNMSFPVMGCGKVSETLSSHCNLPTPTSGFTLPMSSSAGPGKLRPGWTKSPPSSSARHK